MLVFILQYAVALPNEFADKGYGKTDYAVFYMAGNSILGKGNISPQELYDRSLTKVELKSIRNVNGGNRYIYLPPAAFFFVPLALVDFPVSYQSWLILNPLLMIVGFYLSISLLVGDKDIWKLRYSVILFALAFSPIISASIRTGQINSVLWIAFVLGFYGLYKNNHATAAFAFVFTTLFKFFPVIFGLYAILKKQWRTVWYSLGFGGALIVVSLFFFGVEPYNTFFTFILPKIADGNMWDMSGSSSILGSLVYAREQGFFKLFGFEKAETLRAMKTIQWALSIPILLASGYLLWVHRKAIDLRQYLFDYSIIMLVLILIPKNIHPAYHIWLFPFVLFLISQPLKKQSILPLLIGFSSLILLFFRNVTNLLHMPYIRLETIGLLVLFVTLFLILAPVKWKRAPLTHLRGLKTNS